ncbi:MAG: transposase [Armatimonadota bacterium]
MNIAYASTDVSKGTLDCCLLLPVVKPKYRKFPNNAKGHEDYRFWTKEHTQGMEVRHCMEATGCYHLGLASFLAEKDDWVSVENPRRIKHFAIAANLKNKNDKVDSYCIARYAQALSPREWILKDPHRRELDAMRTRLRQLKQDISREENRLENIFLPELSVLQIRSHVEFLEGQIAQVEQRVREILAEFKPARDVYNAIVQMKGAGPETALLLASIDVQKFECAKVVPVFFGINPRQHQSGKKQGTTTISKAGDAVGRSLLVSAAISAARHNEVLKAFYDKLRTRGLKHKQALAAVARKLLMITWAIAKATLEQRPVYYPGGTKISRQAKKYCITT